MLTAYLRTFLFLVIFFIIPAHADPAAEFAKLETLSGGKLGIAAINTGNQQKILYHAFERFPMGCTSKVIGVAAILKQSMANPDLLNERIFYSKNSLKNWTPITAKHIEDGMTLEELCAAAISYSDNTAMNLLAQKLDGAHGLNKFARSIGDNDFKQDHLWPEEALGNLKNLSDSTTPIAMAQSLQKLVLGEVLAPMPRTKLRTWLIANVTGKARIRAGTPKTWTVGDKTGTGFYYGTTNDIAVIWPPHTAPIVIAIYYSSLHKNSPKRDDIIAAATKIILAALDLNLS